MSQGIGDVYWGQTSAPNDSDVAQGGSNNGSAENQNFGTFVIFVIACSAGATAFLLFVIFLQELYWRTCGVGKRQRSRDAFLESDRALAEELQLRLNEDEAQRITKENERRAWYEAYMKKFTMIAESKDLFLAQDPDDPAIHKQEENGNDHVPPQTEVESRPRKYLQSDFSEISDEEIEDIESSGGTTRKVNVAERDKGAQLYLRLPVKDEKGNFRTVDAECAICFSDYKVGDKISWSELQCHHAYHNECILAWLVKGKKRCPTCRHWFVPGALIEDQKQELEERRRRAEAEGVASSSENADDTHDESQSDSDHNDTLVEIATGDYNEPVFISSLSSQVDVESGNASEVAPVDSARMPSTTTALSLPPAIATTVATPEP